MSNTDVEILDYDEFYSELKESNYIPLRIDDEWLIEHENFVRENLYSIYVAYQREPRLLNMLFRLFGDMLMNAYNEFKDINYNVL